MIVKICGITSQPDADAATEGGANAIGFNFYPPSPRYIAPERAAEIATPAGVRRVGVFVNEARARVEEIARIVRLHVAQLHGGEAPADYPVAVAVWKAVRVAEGFDLSKWLDCPAEALLLDGPAGEMYGGAGKTFDWGLAGPSGADLQVCGGPPGPPAAEQHFAEGRPGGRPCPEGPHRGSAPHIVLAGGLDASNVAQAVALARPWGVDACSRIESAPGKKDHRKMLEFLTAARAALGV
jgi:phosphoribosylanthranilate isomerase